MCVKNEGFQTKISQMHAPELHNEQLNLLVHSQCMRISVKYVKGSSWGNYETLPTVAL